MSWRCTLSFFAVALGLNAVAQAKESKSSIRYESSRGKTYEIIENTAFSTLAERSKDPSGKTTRLVMQKTMHSKFEVKDGRNMQEHPDTSLDIKVYRVAGKSGESFTKPIGAIKNTASSVFFIDNRIVPLIVTGYEACCATTESFDAYSLEGKLIGTYDGSAFYRVNGLSQGVRYLSFLSSSGNRSKMASEKGDLGILSWSRPDGVLQKVALVSKKAEGWGMAPHVDISVSTGTAPLTTVEVLDQFSFTTAKSSDRAPASADKSSDHVAITLAFREIGTATILIENDRFAVGKAVLSEDMKLVP